MSVGFERKEDNGLKVNIEVDCPCQVGICSHALVEVEKALQASYDKGLRDGSSGALTEFREALKKEFPNEFKAAEKSFNNKRAN